MDSMKVFKALGEGTRMKIIKLLSIQRMCVCELAEVLEMLQPRISQHLKILKEAGLVTESKEGYWVYYSLERGRVEEAWNNFTRFLDADPEGLVEYQGMKDRIANLGCKVMSKDGKITLKK